MATEEKRKRPADMSTEEVYDWIKVTFDEEAAEKFKGRFNIHPFSIQQKNGAKVGLCQIEMRFFLKQNKK